MTSRIFFRLIVLLTTLVCLPHSLAQDTPQWHLPEGVKARIGKGRMNDIALSPDNQQLAVATDIGIWVYNVSTGAEVALLTEHTGRVNSVAYSPDGRRLAGAGDGVVRLWDPYTENHIRIFTRQSGDSLVYSPDGNTIAVGGWQGIDLLNARTGKLKATLSGGSASVDLLAFSADSNTLASATRDSQDATIRLWNGRTGRLKRRISGHTEAIHSLVFSSTQNVLISGGYRTIRFWNADSGKNTKTLAVQSDSLAYSPDDSKIAVGTRNVRLFNVDTARLQQTFFGHKNGVAHIVFSSDGNTLVSASWGGAIRLWNALTGDLRLTLVGHFNIRSSALSPDGTTLATISGDGIFLWNASTGKFKKAFEVGHRSNTVAYSPEGQTLAIDIWDDGPKIHLVNANTGKIWRILHLVDDAVDQLVFSPNERWLAGGSWNTTVRLWNAKNWEFQRTLSGHTGGIAALAFSPDSRTLASASSDHEDRRVHLWNLNTGEVRWTLSRQRDSVRSLAFSPDGTRLAVGSWNEIRLWNPANGQLQRTLNDSSGAALAYSPDGQRLAAGGNSGIQLWNPQSGQFQRSLSGHTVGVNWLVFLPDGNTLISRDSGATFLLWDLNAVAEDVNRTVAEDVNRDGVIDVEDLVTVASSFGNTVAQGVYPNPDVNRDGVVNRADILAVLALLEATADAPSAAPRLTVQRLQRWIDAAKRLDNTGEAFQEGIRVLEQFLVTLRTSQVLPRETAVFANYPNPFNPETWIPYQLAEASDVKLQIYDVRGSVVREFALGHTPAGVYTDRSRAAHWDGKNAQGEPVTSGVYFFTFTAGDFTVTRKMLILK